MIENFAYFVKKDNINDENTKNELLSDIHCCYGRFEKARGHSIEAKSHFNRAIEINNNNFSAHNSLAILNENEHKYNQAEIHYKNGLEACGWSDDTLLHNYGKLLKFSQANTIGRCIKYFEDKIPTNVENEIQRLEQQIENIENEKIQQLDRWSIELEKRIKTQKTLEKEISKLTMAVKNQTKKITSLENEMKNIEKQTILSVKRFNQGQNSNDDNSYNHDYCENKRRNKSSSNSNCNDNSNDNSTRIVDEIDKNQRLRYDLNETDSDIDIDIENQKRNNKNKTKSKRNRIGKARKSTSKHDHSQCVNKIEKLENENKTSSTRLRRYKIMNKALQTIVDENIDKLVDTGENIPWQREFDNKSEQNINLNSQESNIEDSISDDGSQSQGSVKLNITYLTRVIAYCCAFSWQNTQCLTIKIDFAQIYNHLNH